MTLLLSLLAGALVAADTTTYLVVNHGRPAGAMYVIRSGDSVIVRYQHADRNRGNNIAGAYRIDASGRVIGAEVRAWPFGGEIGAPTDRFQVIADSATWGVVDAQRGGARVPAGGYVRLRGAATAFDNALLARHLLRQPNQTARLLPQGVEARAVVVGDTVVSGPRGPERVRLVMLHTNNSATPTGIWLDQRDELVASEIGWFITVRPALANALPALRAVEMAWREGRAAAIARQLPRPTDGTVVIRNGDVFDSERGVIVPRTTVVIRGDRIVATGAAADAMTVPANATVIDATGRTVMPGMWDMHGHFMHTSQTGGAVLQLATGITTVRDLAADLDVAVSLRDRSDRGELLAPRALLGGFLEGPQAWAGPSEAIVRTEAEARAWVARYDSLGYRQIKLYNLVHPDLVPTIAEEAHRRGMRLSGHVPRGLSLPAAIALGFDEINHAAFLFSTFFQDSLYLPRMRAYSAVASAVAPFVNVDGPEFTRMIDLMRRSGTVLDGTFNIWVSQASAAVGAPPVNERGIANYLRLITRLDSAGVVLVPGTDNSAGTTYIAELETYARAGVPAARVLQMATIISARVMRDDREYGSIAPGKVADVLIVDGRPHERLADLARLTHVIRAGRVYTPTELREAIGMRSAGNRRLRGRGTDN